MSEHVILLSIPGLRVRDIAEASTPTLHRWASQGALATLVPTFPCVTSPVQASMLTGTPPGEHGVIANGFYHRHRREVEFWVADHGIIQRPTIWEAIREQRPDFRSAVWHAQNSKQCPADFIVTPAPIHESDGTTKLWCYSKPDGLYQELLDEFGHFPLQHYWGPLANIESTRWIIQAACRLIERQAPNFHYIYIPHLDYAAQRFGPDSEQAQQSLVEMDAELAKLDAFVADSPIAGDAVFLVASEYAMTPVTGAVFPNRALREAGLLKTHETADGEVIDYAASDAFAIVDHQFAHVYAKTDRIDVAADVCVLCCHKLRGLHQEQAHVGAFNRSYRADGAVLFDSLLGAPPAPQPRGVEERQVPALVSETGVDRVASRAGRRANYRPFFARERVEQRRFANVRPPDDSDAYRERVAQSPPFERKV